LHIPRVMSNPLNTIKWREKSQSKGLQQQKKAYKPDIHGRGPELSKRSESESAALKKRVQSERPYVKESILNTANRERVGERERQDSYSGWERIPSASSNEVSSNTPKGEDI